MESNSAVCTPKQLQLDDIECDMNSTLKIRLHNIAKKKDHIGSRTNNAKCATFSVCFVLRPYIDICRIPTFLLNRHRYWVFRIASIVRDSFEL